MDYHTLDSAVPARHALLALDASPDLATRTSSSTGNHRGWLIAKLVSFGRRAADFLRALYQRVTEKCSTARGNAAGRMQLSARNPTQDRLSRMSQTARALRASDVVLDAVMADCRKIASSALRNTMTTEGLASRMPPVKSETAFSVSRDASFQQLRSAYYGLQTLLRQPQHDQKYRWDCAASHAITQHLGKESGADASDCAFFDAAAKMATALFEDRLGIARAATPMMASERHTDNAYRAARQECIRSARALASPAAHKPSADIRAHFDVENDAAYEALCKGKRPESPAEFIGLSKTAYEIAGLKTEGVNRYDAIYFKNESTLAHQSLAHFYNGPTVPVSGNRLSS